MCCVSRFIVLECTLHSVCAYDVYAISMDCYAKRYLLNVSFADNSLLPLLCTFHSCSSRLGTAMTYFASLPACSPHRLVLAENGAKQDHSAANRNTVPRSQPRANQSYKVAIIPAMDPHREGKRGVGLYLLWKGVARVPARSSPHLVLARIRPKSGTRTA